MLSVTFSPVAALVSMYEILKTQFGLCPKQCSKTVIAVETCRHFTLYFNDIITLLQCSKRVWNSGFWDMHLVSFSMTWYCTAPYQCRKYHSIEHDYVQSGWSLPYVSSKRGTIYITTEICSIAHIHIQSDFLAWMVWTGLKQHSDDYNYAREALASIICAKPGVNGRGEATARPIRWEYFHQRKKRRNVGVEKPRPCVRPAVRNSIRWPWIYISAAEFGQDF